MEKLTEVLETQLTCRRKRPSHGGAHRRPRLNASFRHDEVEFAGSGRQRNDFRARADGAASRTGERLEQLRMWKREARQGHDGVGETTHVGEGGEGVR